jgi:hypothetical protein
VKLVLDPERSRVRLRTFAEGLFSRLAHDLELSCRGLVGSAERTSDREGSATIEVPIARIDVAGTLKSGRVDPNGLSISDRADCLEKMRKDVFHSNDGKVRVETSLVGASRARLSIVPPKGRTVERSIEVKLASEENAVRVSGAFEISLNAIGANPVKGPMNAFRVKDSVELLFDVVFVPT